MKTNKKQGYLEGNSPEKLTKEIVITSPVVLFKNVYLENFFFFWLILIWTPYGLSLLVKKARMHNLKCYLISLSGCEPFKTINTSHRKCAQKQYPVDQMLTLKERILVK